MANETHRLWEKQAKWLTHTLIISVAINIGLLFTCFYLLSKDRSLMTVLDHRPSLEEREELLNPHPGIVELLREFRSTPFEQLIVKLNDTRLVEDGYKQRDLALAALVSFYHFNLQAALSNLPFQQRHIILEKKNDSIFSSATVYPNLSDSQFKAIVHYATSERWPLTSRGLFLQIKHTQGQADPSLMEAFFLTSEFLEVMTLFSHSQISRSLIAHSRGNADKYVILAMLREGDWQTLQQFAESQLVAQDLSEAKIKELLLSYVTQKSKIAARLLLLNYMDFAVKRLDDQQAIALLQMLKQKTPENERFAKELLVSPRSDTVIQMAAARLYQFAREPLPEIYDHGVALTKFIPEQILKQKIKFPIQQAPVSIQPDALLPQLSESKSTSISSPSLGKSSQTPQVRAISPPVLQTSACRERYHIVEEGESLWSIAKNYRVDVEKLRVRNGVDATGIYAGLVLRIPID